MGSRYYRKGEADIWLKNRRSHYENNSHNQSKRWTGNTANSKNVKRK